MENFLRETPEVQLEDTSQSAARRFQYEAGEFQRDGSMCGSGHTETLPQSHPSSEWRTPIKI